MGVKTATTPNRLGFAAGRVYGRSQGAKSTNTGAKFASQGVKIARIRNP
jgi:hypothetical protein